MSLSSGTLSFSVSAISTPPLRFFEALPHFPGTSVSRIHVDVMDGQFVPRLGLYPEFVAQICELSDMPIDVHMMTESSEPYFEVFADAGASRVIPHIESMQHVHRSIQRIRETGAEAGLALNLHTELSGLRYVAQDLSSVLLMAINPGIVGHGFIHAAYTKISEARDFLNSLGFRGTIEVDGGVTFDNIPRIRRCGASSMVVGAGSLFRPDRTLIENLARLEMLSEREPT